MNTFKKITLTSAVAFALFAFNACGDDSGSTSASGENSTLSSAVEDDESSSSINGDNSSVTPGSSSSVILSDSEGSSSSSSVKVNGKSSSSSKRDDISSSSSSLAYRRCQEGTLDTLLKDYEIVYVRCQNDMWRVDSIVKLEMPKVYPDMDSVFGSKATYGTFTDPRDGKVYRTVKSFDMDGNYSFTVMAQNLNFADTVLDIATTIFDDAKIEKSCYKDDPWYCDNYFGALYSWSEAMGLPKVCDSVSVADNPKCTANFNDKYPEDSKVRGVCPEGWHVMNETEWKHVAITPAGIDLSHSLLSQAIWSHKFAVKNSYGMSILPHGDDGYEKELANFWIPSEKDLDVAKTITFSLEEFSVSKSYKRSHLNIRCVLDY
ncbi:FISUMP domain-containing protein [Fibrobacter sp. UWH1]|uniref:FISUMP domain-containing protein n=1 Tax=Fibrobacter sp. UWH1 TaxID=1964354 RepID=UPI000B527CAA|nr:FISUMP domain-containing protein [Fibrobacter sp. UWH1]OWV03808.1 hypothetical protein B7992_16065 [Fibrobacter sp. UWH1]